MNKKFSTLVASLLLATTVGTGYAQVQKGTISEAPGSYVAAIENGKFYQLTNGTQVLIMDKTSEGTYVLKFVDYNRAELAKSLWEIKTVKNNNENGIAFQFVNLTTGLPISFDPKSANELGSRLTVTELSQGTNHWSWLRGTEGAALVASKSVEAYFGAKNDSIITLINTSNGVAAVKYATKDVASIPSHLKFTAKEASPVYLNAYDLNTMLQSRDAEKGLTLTFNDEPANPEFVNKFTERSYKAVNPVGEGLYSGSKSDAKAAMDEADKVMEAANKAYYEILSKQETSNIELQKLLAELLSIEKKMQGVNSSLGEAKIVESGAQQDYDDALIKIGEIQQQIKDYIAENGDSDAVIADIAEKESLYAGAQEVIKDLETKKDAEEIKLEEKRKERANYISGNPLWFLNSAKKEIVAGFDARIISLENSIKEYQDNLETAEDAVGVAFDNLVEAEKVAAGRSELSNELGAAKADLAEKTKYLKEAQDKVSGLENQIAEYEDAHITVYFKFSAIGEELSDMMSTVWEKEALKDAANQAYFNAVDRYVAVQYWDKDWYSLQADGKYLMVDTAYMETKTSGVKHQKFALNEFKKFEAINGNIWNARDINGRFNFCFKYYPTVDSLVITSDGGNDKYETVTYWKDRKDYQISPIWGRNFVKLAYLSDNHQEVTLGVADQILGTWNQTLNTRIGLNLVSATPGKDIPAGVYFADIVKDKDNLDAISRLMLDLDGEFTKVATAEWNVMKFEDMPAAKWVVKENTIYNGSPAVMNQESAELLNRGAYRIQDVKEDGTVILFMSWYNYQGLREDATIKLTLVPELNQLGYINKGFSVNTDSLFSLNYLNVAGNVSVQIGTGNDTILRVADGEGTKFILENVTKDAEKYGVDNAFLKRAYYIRVNDANKLNNNYKYVTVSDVDGTELMVVSGKENRAQFYLKEVNHADGTHYFALISGDKKAGVIDASGLIKAEDITGETRTSAFALNFDKTAYYRLFTAEELGENGVLNFYRTNTAEKAYLYEKDNLLEVENKGDNVGDLADLNVIPAVKEGIMPQYFIAKNVKVVEADTILCTENHASVEEALGCEHTKYVKDTIYGDFMVNFKIDADLDKANLWENKYSRLGFLNGYITNGKLYINEDSVSVTENVHNATKFSFRLVDEEDAKDFLIESESWGDKTAFDGGIRPFGKGGWIKVQNTVPVIVKTDYEDAIASADLFNVDTNAGGATANDEITTSEITVIAGEGNVTIANAAGKKVVVSNILGQTVATQVLTSDNAVIAAPQGVIVVAVEGEEAVKAIVK